MVCCRMITLSMSQYEHFSGFSQALCFYLRWEKLSPFSLMLLTTIKSFALGAKENEVKTSLDLLDRTIKALRTSVVDDVHLCLRIADLLEGLTTSVRHKFVRLAGHSADRAAQQDNMVPSDSGGPPYLSVQTPEGL